MPLSIRLDAHEATRILTRFIRDSLAAAGARGAVLGLSGGIDSAVVAALAVQALGRERVHPFALPGATSQAADLDDARTIADALGLHLEIRSIAPIVDGARASIGPDGDLDQRLVANITARARMIVLYAEAARRGCFVLGTGNKSELLTGYFTKHGDGGTDLLPIGDLYKTQVRLLARHLDLPQRILDKTPSAGLWQGQTDEGELGITYPALDQVLLGLEIDLPHPRIAAAAGVDVAEVRRIEAMRRRSQHKREPPLVCKLGIRSLGTDWRDSVTGTADA